MRDPRAGYIQSLNVLRAAKECGVYTKSSLMLGLGETDDEIIDTMLDMRDAGEFQLWCPCCTVVASSTCGVYERVSTNP